MAFEDGVVLADMLVAADTVDDAFWQAFTDRRMPRAATVVELSNTLAQWQLDHVQGDMGAVIGRLAATVIPPRMSGTTSGTVVVDVHSARDRARGRDGRRGRCRTRGAARARPASLRPGVGPRSTVR